jgi:hypothetical protein
MGKLRKHEHLKPKPRPENAIILTKKSVAASQLNTAIELWFRDGDPVSILMLAFNAHELFHALGDRNGKPSELQTLLEAMPESFQARWRYVWNYCKHGWKDLDEETPYDPRFADFIIYFAAKSYCSVCGQPTSRMFAFNLRFNIENPGLIPEAAEAVWKLRDVYDAARISRQDFLDEYLPLIESGQIPSEFP